MSFVCAPGSCDPRGSGKGTQTQRSRAPHCCPVSLREGKSSSITHTVAIRLEMRPKIGRSGDANMELISSGAQTTPWCDCRMGEGHLIPGHRQGTEGEAMAAASRRL